MELKPSSLNGLREFGPFRLDTVARVLWLNDRIVDLPPKAIEVLCVLTEIPGEVVAKADLIERVWPESFVEESNLTHQVYELRKAFKEAGCNEEFIQTVPRRGYRFAAPLSLAYRGDAELVIERTTQTRSLVAEVDDSPTTSPPLALPPAPASRLKPWMFAALILLLVTVGVAAWRWNARPEKTSLSQIRSLAVLPLQSFSGEEDESLRMRLTDSLITKLGELKEVSVRPTSSVARYAANPIDPAEAGRIFGVDAVLTGRTQTESNRIRVTLQLVSVATGEQIWSDRYDGEPTRLLDFQDAVASRLAKAFDLTPPADFERSITKNSDAFEEYLKGRYHWNKRTAESLNLSIAAFGNAIKLDPDFAEAHAGLADSYFLLVDYSYDSSPKNVRIATENLDRALALKPDLADAHVTRGLIQSSYEWRWRDAENSFRRAVELAPDSANAHHRFGLLLAKLRRFDEAESEMRRARSLDPVSPGINMNLGVVLYFAGRYDEAEAQLRRAIDLDGRFASPRWYLARCLWMKGDRAASIAEYANAARSIGDEDSAKLLDANVADPDAAIAKLIDLWKPRLGLKGINPHDLAVLYALRGDRDATLHWLERSVTDRHAWASVIHAEPEMDFVRSEPRFQDLLKKLNF